MNAAIKFPTKKAFRYPKSGLCVESHMAFKILFFFYNTIPALIFDAFLYLRGLKPMDLMKVTREVYFRINVFYKYDITFTFDNYKLIKIEEEMTDGDRFHFPCTMKSKDFEQFVVNTIQGLRVYFLRETNQDLEAAKKKLQKLYFLDISLNLLTLFGLFLLCQKYLPSPGFWFSE